MTGFDIFESAMLKLGYTDSKETVEEIVPFKKIALDAINEISADISNEAPITSLFDTINLDPKAKSVVSYGVAMFISLFNNDTRKNTIMTTIFNARRAAYLSDIKKIKDTSPNIYGI